MKAGVKKCLGQVVMATAKKSVNSASAWKYYQPKETEALKTLKK